MSGLIEETEALILRLVDYGERDRIVGMLTRSRGKLSAFAASARRSMRRFGGALDLFSLVRAELRPPKGEQSSLWRLNSIESIDPHLPIRNDVKKMAEASYLADCTWALSGDEDPQGALLEWWKRTLRGLCEVAPSEVSTMGLDLELLALCGFAPRWEGCIECGRSPAEAKIFFSFERGGVVCKACARRGEGRWLDRSTVDALARGSEVPVANVPNFRQVIDHFVIYTLGREPKSRKFREEVFRGS